MNDALSLIYRVLTGLFDFLFSAYFFEGVSLGMFLLGVGLFVILLSYVVAIPKMHVGNKKSSRSYGNRGGNDNESK